MSWYRQQQQKSADQFKKPMKEHRKQRLAMQAKRTSSMNQPFNAVGLDEEMDYKRSRLEQDSDND